MAKKTVTEELTVPKAILETVTAAALVSAGKFVYDASKDTYVALKPDKPLQVAIADSVTTSDSHRILARITNLGIHTVYLEAVQAIDPTRIAIDAAHVTERKIGWDMGNFGGEKEQIEKATAFPHRLPSNETVNIDLTLSLQSAKRLKSKPYATLAVQYRVLGLASKVKSHRFGVAIR